MYKLFDEAKPHILSLVVSLCHFDHIYSHLVAEALHLPWISRANFTLDYFKIANAAKDINNKLVTEKIGHQFSGEPFFSPTHL